MVRKLGFWKECGWPHGVDSVPSEITEYVEGHYTVDNSVLKYLESGIAIMGLRSLAYCPFGREMTGGWVISTDGVFIWTSQYVYYVKRGVLPMDENLLAYMAEQQYCVPSVDAIDANQLTAVKKAI
ncbi:MAG: hypothetical protein AAGJ82_09075 [Bacteroidota bacterium]